MDTPSPASRSLFVLVGSGNPSKIAAVRLAFLSLYPSLDPESLHVEGLPVDSGVSAQPINDEETYRGAIMRAQNVLRLWKEKEGERGRKEEKLGGQMVEGRGAGKREELDKRKRGRNERQQGEKGEESNQCTDGTGEPCERSKGCLHVCSTVGSEKGSLLPPDYVVGLEGGVKEEPFPSLCPPLAPPSSPPLHCFAWMAILEPRTGRWSGAKTASFPLPGIVATMVRAGVELGEADDRVFGREKSKERDGVVGLLTGGIVDRAAFYAPAVVLAMIPFGRYRGRYAGG
ncbi:hypothetical protein NSK_006322 [Nannochloropsis salina CCMP1776]|jgi:non-canonical (house-cleaning) NTP pyrophosphatase|uniref:inosine/xanthosine triphosphatase n=1 Tax=Nannochloropsis salina CCMP1776 TaxID=1027361 RepID=A0A4D9D127_9STRA|nr:hypothetical protein NSK_006322 [Nannochloropsis salina CCMP1776]|eukprot:TFJ82349.1 hypothetical protein NSK_006322 [Nannochloropsis salina CCMP1776]